MSLPFYGTGKHRVEFKERGRKHGTTKKNSNLKRHCEY